MGLVVPGGWFRIVLPDELIRLARVRVDVPVDGSLLEGGHQEMMAEPLAALRPELKRISAPSRFAAGGFTRIRAFATKRGAYPALMTGRPRWSGRMEGELKPPVRCTLMSATGSGSSTMIP